MENNNANEKKVLLSVQDLFVKFRVRGRILTAIRGISLDIYENESIAIVGESGSGKSVFTKTFAGMLDDNGFIDNGNIIFNDEELADTCVPKGRTERSIVGHAYRKLNRFSSLEFGADTYKEILELKHDKKIRMSLSDEDEQAYKEKINAALFRRTEAYNRKQTYASSEKDKIKAANEEIDAENAKINALGKEMKQAIKEHKAALKKDAAYQAEYAEKMLKLKAQYVKET